MLGGAGRVTPASWNPRKPSVGLPALSPLLRWGQMRPACCPSTCVHSRLSWDELRDTGHLELSHLESEKYKLHAPNHAAPKREVTTPR